MISSVPGKSSSQVEAVSVQERDRGLDGAPASDLEQAPAPVDLVLSVAQRMSPSAVGAAILLRASTPGDADWWYGTPGEGRRLAGVEQSCGNGPCLHAARTGSQVRAAVPSGAWSVFSRSAASIALRSVWAVPLQVDGWKAGSLAVYSTSDRCWDEHTDALPLVAELAGALVAIMRSSTRLEVDNEHLHRALETRTTIGQAQGILMARQRITADEAFDVLRRASQRMNVKLRDVAERLVCEQSTAQQRGESAAGSPR